MSREGRLVAVAALAIALAALRPVAAQEAEKRRGFTVTITSPAKDEFVLGKTKIAATVKFDDADRIDRVEFLIGDQIVYVDRQAPYEGFYDFGETSRSWVVRAIAYLKDGISVSDAVVTRKIVISHVEEVNRVILWVSATDKNDKPIGELGRESFTLSEEGRPMQLEEFYLEDRPVTLAILLDSSLSMRDKLKEVHEAASAFVETIRPDDRAFVIDFNDNVFMIQEPTSDHEALRDAIASTEALQGTAIHDALHAAFRKLRGIEGRRAIVLLTDGRDESSQIPFGRILEEAKLVGVPIYAIGVGIDALDGSSRKVLSQLSDVTGGRAFFVKKADEISGAYRDIADELRRQYYVTYSSPNRAFDGRWIAIGVAPRNADWKVRARRGYFAVR